MNRTLRLALVFPCAVAALPGVTTASDAIASGPKTPAPPAYTFCYAYGTAKDGSPMTYYTGVFPVAPDALNEMQAAYRRHLAGKYGSRPQLEGTTMDVNCVMPSPSSQSAAQQQMSNYLGNMRRGGGKVTETGWQYSAPQATPAPAAKPVSLPSDPRIAGASPEMRSLLEGRKKDAGQMCLIANGDTSAGPVYDCPCYEDRVVIATVDEGSKIVQSVDDQKRPANMLSPPIELIVPKADLHTCLNQASLPKRAFTRGMQMAGRYTGQKRNQFAQCVSDSAMAAFKTRPSQNIQAFDNLVLNTYGECSSRIQ